MLTLFLLSCSVAADATAVAVAASVRGVTLWRGLILACCFGVAQAVMAGIGWAGGTLLGDLWSSWDHWVALILLSAVGIKMIQDAFDPTDARPAGAGWPAVLVLSIATSLDALAVGVSLPALKQPAAVALAMIGAVTFLLCSLGAACGRILGVRFGRAIEIAGGVGLIAIGVSIVIQHTQ